MNTRTTTPTPTPTATLGATPSTPDAFAGYIEKVRTETGYTVLVGKA